MPILGTGTVELSTFIVQRKLLYNVQNMYNVIQWIFLYILDNVHCCTICFLAQHTLKEELSNKILYFQAVYNRREEFFLFSTILEATMIDKRLSF